MDKPGETALGAGESSKSEKKGRPSPEEIEAKRRARAEKKAREEQERQEAQRVRQLQLEEAGGGDDVRAKGEDGQLLFVPRKWSPTSKEDEAAASKGESSRKIKLLSWNILAQGLVRRKLFPGSDCLRWKDREAGLSAEMLATAWDVGCFQEVDRIEDHGPKLVETGRSYLYAKGYARKQHGLMIAWNTAKWHKTRFKEKPAGSKIVYLDDECIEEDEERIQGSGLKRSGLSRVTRNIGLFAALALEEPSTDSHASKDGKESGIIVATTHLFWHPMHAYERVRQSGLLKRALLQWREENEAWRHWPMVLAGDFNDQPHSATYALMTGSQISEHGREEVARSTVVHASVDERSVDAAARDVGKLDISGKRIASSAEKVGTVPTEKGGEAENEDGEKEEDEEEKEGEGDGEGEGEEADEDENAEGSDQMLKNCRAAREQDGLLTFEDLLKLHEISKVSSAYGQNFGRLQMDQEGNYFGSKNRGRERYDDADWTEGQPNVHLGPSKEPMWTLFSSIFSLTLDYIFLFPPPSSTASSSVSALLPTHKTEVLQPGIPRKGVCASDHIAIGAELSL